MRIIAAVFTLVFAFAGAADVIPVGAFDSIALSDGGTVVVRHGPVHRVTMTEGDPQFTRVRVQGRRLVIDNGVGSCPRGYQMRIEVETPRLSAVSVSNGGTVRSEGAFPVQKAIDAAVDQGGSIDIRSIAADDVDASVNQGGRIFTTAQKALKGAVSYGGVITYWGDADEISKSIRDGGAVRRGE